MESEELIILEVMEPEDYITQEQWNKYFKNPSIYFKVLKEQNDAIYEKEFK